MILAMLWISRVKGLSVRTNQSGEPRIPLVAGWADAVRRRDTLGAMVGVPQVLSDHIVFAASLVVALSDVVHWLSTERLGRLVDLAEAVAAQVVLCTRQSSNGIRKYVRFAVTYGLQLGIGANALRHLADDRARAVRDDWARVQAIEAVGVEDGEAHADGRIAHCSHVSITLRRTCQAGG